MLIRFWGVRGSIPTPLMPAKLRSKISSVLQRVSAADIESQESRELFLSSLPDYLFSTVGGNTACVEVRTSEDCRFIFDAGTGIRDLGAEIVGSRKSSICHVFFSHFHWDHIQGLPFFGPAFDARNRISFYSPIPTFRSILENQMKPPYFPITMDVMAASKHFHVLDGAPVKVGGVEILYRPMNHPGGCYSYEIRESGLKVIYSTDTELREEDFRKSPANAEYFQNADLMILDTQYTLGEAIEKYNWGHSSFSLAADFAASWSIKRLVLFHHEPSYSDRKIEGIFKNAEWYVEHLESRGIEVYLAHEGLEIEI
ncbi:MAG TPA: MBL fold metallo-hydrolase [Rectinemataceae bacterium]|nr:MBL fold metallo-hydrolase [Rectinemataceae bacterium]